MKLPKTITVISQKYCAYSIGYDSILLGISEECRKQHITPHFFSISADEIPSAKYPSEIILILGYTEAWTTALLQHLAERGHTMILLGNTLPFMDSQVNTVSIDHKQAMMQSISYLQTAGRKQIAFLGYNRISMSSLKFEETFRRFYPSEHLFENYGSIDELCDRFLTQHEKFDSVICFIDKIAIVLMNKAAQRNLAIPEELYVMSFGGTRISQFCTPALTTVSLNYYQCGCTAVSMISLLHTSEQDPVHITLQNDFYTRASTAELPFVPTTGLTPVSYNENVEEITQDQNFLDIGKLERLFTYCDDVDMQILQKLWKNETYEQISEELPMAITTIYYRLRKLLQHADIRGKQELFQLLDHYNIRLKAAE